ncbi:hypothetical protein MMPV_000883 [Pyropia vietnamensis]
MSGPATPARLRLMSDLKAMMQEPPEGCSASPLSEENLFVWGATIFGPLESLWEGGVYALRLTFSEQYPEKPPRVRFTCQMFHPNDPNASSPANPEAAQLFNTDMDAYKKRVRRCAAQSVEMA